MRTPSSRQFGLSLLLLLAVIPTAADAQVGGALRRRAEEEARRRAAAEAQAKARADSTRAAASRDSVARADSARAGAAGGAPTAPTRQDPKVWDNYDFVPGSKVLFYTDFSEDRVGNFARGLKFKSGSMDVVERDGVKMLRSVSRGEFMVPVGMKLPERFTLEIDVIAPADAVAGYDILAFEGGSVWDRSAASAEINWASTGTVIIGGGQTPGTSTVNFPEGLAAQNRGNVTHVRMLVDGPYVKLYSNERRVYNIPELGFKRDSLIRFLVKGAEEPNRETYVAMIRVAESEVDVLYDALTAKGRWVTQGIQFEISRADLRPESRPVLKEIAETMAKYPDLRILIEGHTDNTGTAAGNLTLSDARAAAVKAALVADFAIAADRLTTKGMGDTAPAAPNTTATGRAQNRRVEIVKQ
jgi:outer membrane protein OmpA-like peptidoglycan-associated protein